jgi:glycine/D-amino acid oxidase-like deaminating enzyme
MTDERGAPDRDAGDVLILGAGIAGLLVARALTIKGYQVTLVEGTALASGQSAHSHGYLHRGYIYLDPTDKLVGPLQASATYWEQLISDLGVQLETRESLIGLASDYQAEYALGKWAMANLRGHRPSLPEDRVDGTPISKSLLASPCKRFVVSPEKVANFSKVTASLVVNQLGACTLVHGVVMAIDVTRDRVNGVHIRLADGTPVRAVAGLYLFATGLGTRALIKAARGYAGPITLRQSYMLVLRHPDLPVISAVFPGQATYGLFIAPRRPVAAEPPVWLASNFSSFAGLDHGHTTARLWLRQIARTLTEHTDVLDLTELEWAYYPAPKAEVRGVTTLERPRVIDCGWRNAAAAFPTKLTLAPALVDQIITWAGIHRHELRVRRPARHLGSARPPVAKELWRSCTWYHRDMLLAIRDAHAALRAPPWSDPEPTVC